MDCPPAAYDMGLIKAMTAMTARGRSRLLRPDGQGRSLDPYRICKLRYALVRIGAVHGIGRSGASMMGVFNMSQSLMNPAIVSIFDFLEVHPDQNRYVVYSYFGQKHTETRTGESHENVVSLSLGPLDCEILTAFPLQEFWNRQQCRVFAVAVLGLTDKMTGCAAVADTAISFDPDEEPSRVRIMARLKAMGMLSIYVGKCEASISWGAVRAWVKGRELGGHLINWHGSTYNHPLITVNLNWLATRYREVDTGVEVSIEVARLVKT